MYAMNQGIDPKKNMHFTFNGNGNGRSSLSNSIKNTIINDKMNDFFKNIMLVVIRFYHIMTPSHVHYASFTT